MRKICIALIFSIFLLSFTSAGWTSGLNNSLSAYYNLDLNTQDVFRGIYQGIPTGTTNSTGLIENSSLFSAASSDKITLGYANSTEIKPNGNYSIGLWVYPMDFVGGEPIISWVSDGTHFFQIWTGGIGCSNVGDKWQIGYINGGSANCVDGGSNIVAKDRRWQYLNLVQNDTGVYLYVNGTFIATSTNRLPTATTNNQINLGLGYAGWSSVKFNGKIDEVGIWNRSLNQTEITQLYNNSGGISYLSGSPSAPVTPSTYTVSLNYPANNTVFSDIGAYFNATFNSTGLNFTNATYYVWYQNGTIFNTTSMSLLGLNNYTSLFIDSFTLGSYIWNVYGCAANSSDSNCTFSTSNNTFTVGASITSQFSENNVFDTTNTTFRLNVSLVSGASLFFANLVYNGTTYPTTITSLGGDSYSIRKTISLPAVNQDTNFSYYYKFFFDSGGFITQQTGNYYQYVLPSIFTECNSTYTIQAINFSIFNESSPLIPIVSRFQATFNWFLGDGNVVKNKSFDLTGSSNYAFCIYPNSSSFNVDSDIKLSSTGFIDKIYSFLSDVLTNSTVYRSMFLLPSVDGRTVIVEVKDTGLTPLPDYTVKIYRKYIETGNYQLIQESQTDIYGQVVSSLIENTVKYKFEFYDSNGNLKKSTSDLTVACRSSICVLPFVIENTVNDFERFENTTGFSYSFTFDNNTNIFTYTWSDTTGDTNIINRLLVERYSLNGTTQVCNTTSTSLSSSLTCYVGSGIYSYTAQVFRTGQGETIEKRIGIMSVKVGDITRKFGLEGLFWSFIMTMTMIAVGVWNPPVGIGLYLVSVIGLGLAGIIYVNPAIIIAELVLGVAFIWAFKS